MKKLRTETQQMGHAPAPQGLTKGRRWEEVMPKMAH